MVNQVNDCTSESDADEDLPIDDAFVPACTLLGYIDVKCHWTPSMPASILSPYAIEMQYACNYAIDLMAMGIPSCSIIAFVN
jgi:hypothetical protein